MRGPSSQFDPLTPTVLQQEVVGDQVMFIGDGSFVLFLMSAKGGGGGPDGNSNLGACIVSSSG